MINYQNLVSQIDIGDTLFSNSYEESLLRWQEGCNRKGAYLDCVPLKQSNFSLNFAVFGNKCAKNTLLHIAGTHGIEGFLGAAIQLGIINSLDELPDDTNLVMIHCLNPWGMHNLRRTTAENVDLNRNYLSSSADFSGAPESYRALDSFLNPKRKPRKFDVFLIQVLIAILRYGFTPVKQAIAGGQYEFSRGLYFGGKEISDNLLVLSDWLCKNLSSSERVLGIEVHSGLGPYAYDTLFSNLLSKDSRVGEFEKLLNHKLSTDDPAESVGFRTKGDLATGVPSLLSDKRCDWILQEFGTFNVIRMLREFRNENMHHHFGDGNLNHWSKRALFEAFNPRDQRWRKFVVGRGLDLAAKGLEILSTES